MDQTGSTGPAQPGYWDLVGARVREVLATSPKAQQHLVELASLQGQPEVAAALIERAKREAAADRPRSPQLEAEAAN